MVIVINNQSNIKHPVDPNILHQPSHILDEPTISYQYLIYANIISH